MDDAVSRHLCLALLEQFRRRGELLTLAACQFPRAAFRGVLVEHHVKFDEAIHCIMVHLCWADVQRAEQWYDRSGQPPPTTVVETIAMLIRWHHSGLSNAEDEIFRDA